MTTVTITGGAGNLGREVALLLVERGHRVRLFDLPEADFGFAEGQAGLEVFRGDLRDSDSVAMACRSSEWVVHLAAVMPPLSEENRDLARDVNVEGTRAVLRAVAIGTPLVFASSVATYGLSRSEVVRIDHPQRPIDYYAETKLQNEQDIMASGHPHALLRISGISVPALLEIPRPWFFSRDQRVEFVHQRDAATAVAGCVGNARALGGTWQIAGGESWRTTGCGYSQAICEAFDYPVEMSAFLGEPSWPAWYDTRASQALLRYQRHSFSSYCAELRSIYREAVGEGAPPSSALGPPSEW